MSLQRLVLVSVLLFGGCAPAPQPVETPQPVFRLEDAASHTLRVVSSSSAGVSSGSGVAVAQNFVLTNQHVLGPDGADLYVFDNAAGFPRPVGAVIAEDPRLDLALLYVRGIGSRPVTLALAPPRQLENVTALGFPAVTDEIFGRVRDSVSATNGQVTAIDQGSLGSFGPIDLILHTATINPGNSGGPLFNSCGELVGINTLRADPSQASNAYVASSATEVRSFLESFGLTPTTAPAVCGVVQEQCDYDRSALDDALEARDFAALSREAGRIPNSCGELLNEAWSAYRDMSNQATRAFLAMTGTWRLPDQRCEDRVSLFLSGSAVWGVAAQQRQIERLMSLEEGAVTALTVFPEEDNPATYRYSLSGDRLKIENLTSSASYEMERCTG